MHHIIIDTPSNASKNDLNGFHLSRYSHAKEEIVYLVKSIFNTPLYTAPIDGEITKNIDIEELVKYTKMSLGHSTGIAIAKVLRLSDITREEIVDMYRRSISLKAKALNYVKVAGNVSLGGLDRLKEVVQAYKIKRKEDPNARGLNILLTGLPGTGKSLSAKWISKYLDYDLYKLDISATITRALGASEQQIDNDLNIIGELGDVVIHVDEVEKIFAGVQSSADTDGGTLLRIMERFMRYLESPKAGLINVLTANMLDKLPPELLRSGRIDYIFYVDYPSKEEILEILKIHNKALTKPIDFSEEEYEQIADLLLSDKGDKYTGADIETIFKTYDRNYTISKKKEPAMSVFMNALCQTQTTYSKQSEKMDKIEKESIEQFEPASSKNTTYKKYQKEMKAKIEKYAGKITSSRLEKAMQSISGSSAPTPKKRSKTRKSLDL
jgi:SpoVK/Ycf46/Vps4 family AAA+-type ATPase